MKKSISIIMAVILCAAVFSGCTKKLNVDTDTVYVEKNGTVISGDVEKFDKDHYEETELEDYINEQVEEYTKKNGKTVSVESYKVEDSKAKLNMKYDSCQDYSDFNGIELYAGTVVKAQAEGYDFDTDFVKVEEKKKGGSVSKSDVLANDNYKVVVVKANIAVKVAGTIMFVSKENTEVTAKDTVTIKSEGANEEAVLTYIIYK